MRAILRAISDFLWYRSTHFSYWVFLCIWNRLSIKRLGPIPRKGPVVLISNHISNLDPIIVAVCCFKRRFKFFAKVELFEQSKFMNWAMHSYGAFPVQRGGSGDRQAFKKAIEFVQAREALLMFPEGHRSKDGKFQPFQSGAARIALAVPEALIIPLRIRGSFEAMPPGQRGILPKKISVTVGKGFHLSDLQGLPTEKKALYQAVTDEMFKRIESL